LAKPVYRDRGLPAPRLHASAAGAMKNVSVANASIVAKNAEVGTESQSAARTK